MAGRTKKVEKKVEEQVTKAKSFRDLRKLLNSETEVLIMNNTQGHFYYSCPKTHTSVNLTEYGETQIVPLELLETMKRRAKKLFQNYLIMIVDVYAETDEIGVSDVLRYLDLQSLYVHLEENDETTYGEDFFDNLIINKDVDEFESILKKMNRRLLAQFAHRCVELYKAKEFDSRYKMEIIERVAKTEELFSDVDLIK